MDKTSSGTATRGRPRIRLRKPEWEWHLRDRQLTGEDAQKLLGFSQSSLWRIKAGEVQPGPRFIATAIKRLNLSFDALFEVTEEIGE